MKRGLLIGSLCGIAAVTFLIAPGVSSTGDDCYHGRCQGCEDCSQKKGSIRACYQCCNDNCLGEGAIDCQDLCDGRAREQGYAVFADEPVLANSFLGVINARLDAGGSLTAEDLERVDWLSARSESLAIRRMCVAIIFDAWAVGQVMDSEFAAAIIESVLVGEEATLRHTVLVMMTSLGTAPPMDLAIVLPMLVEDSTIGDAAFLAERPDLTVQQASAIAARHRQRAMEAIDIVTR
jgi:hypothetical protein